MDTMRYFDTTDLPTTELHNAIIAAAHQDELVMAIFHTHGRREFLSPSRVHHLGDTMGHTWLLTSVRRSMSVLTGAGQLIKTDHQRMGPYGRVETLWGLPCAA